MCPRLTHNARPFYLSVRLSEKECNDWKRVALSIPEVKEALCKIIVERNGWTKAELFRLFIKHHDKVRDLYEEEMDIKRYAYNIREAKALGIID